MNFVANLPYIKCYVKKEYLYDLTRGHGEFEECVLVAVKSMQGKALIFEAYLPAYGACYDKFPWKALATCGLVLTAKWERSAGTLTGTSKRWRRSKWQPRCPVTTRASQPARTQKI